MYISTYNLVVLHTLQMMDTYVTLFESFHIYLDINLCKPNYFFMLNARVRVE